MNDLSFRNRTDALPDYRLDDRPVDRDTQNPQKSRPQVRRPWGVRVFAGGAFLLLAGGVALGAWRHYAQQQQVMATVTQERDFVPSVRVATVKANAAVMSVTLPRRQPHLRRPRSMPARPAISASVTSTSATASSKARCWRS